MIYNLGRRSAALKLDQLQLTQTVWGFFLCIVSLLVLDPLDVLGPLDVLDPLDLLGPLDVLELLKSKWKLHIFCFPIEGI